MLAIFLKNNHIRKREVKMKDRYWNNITSIYAQQRQKGIENYNMTLEDNQSVDFEDRIQYIEEEMVDSLMYLEWLKDQKKHRQKRETVLDFVTGLCASCQLREECIEQKCKVFRLEQLYMDIINNKWYD